LKLSEINSVYFIGVGGIGMSALARFFVAEGLFVAGYDKTSTRLTDKLIEEGIEISFEDQDGIIPAEMFENDALVVYTPAIPKENKVLNAFLAKGIKTYKRSEVLGIISESFNTVGVAGTHGKTTTSSMIAHVLSGPDTGCNAFLGGIASNYNSNLILNEDSDVCVVEADEFDRSFLTLSPNIGVITSTDADHLDIYGAHDALMESFQMYADRIDRDGTLVLRNGLKINHPNVLTYGFEDGCDYRVSNLGVADGNYTFDVSTPINQYKGIKVGLPGRHNIENALATIAVCECLGLTKENITDRLASFLGVKRRFERIIQSDDLIYIDDYAHHPKELEMCITSVKELYPNKKVTGIFQPHLYSRTRDFADEFGASLSLLSELHLLDIYPARELPIEGVDAEMLLSKVDLENKRVVAKSQVVNDLNQDDLEVLLTLGAGDIDTIVEPIKSKFS